MGNAVFIDIIGVLNGVSPVWVAVLEFVAAYAAVLFMFKHYGKEGLFVYVTMAIILANIQVLKNVSFPFFSDPIPLGTVVFVSTYFATEIVAEHYSKADALKLVSLSFVGYFLFVMLMVIALSFTPLAYEQVQHGMASPEGWKWALPMQDHLMAIFSPAPSIFISSLLAFAAGQVVNIRIFTGLFSKMKRRLLWVRGFVASVVGNFIDNLVFSVFAFIILAKSPLSWEVVMYSYVLGVLMLRVVMAFVEAPMLSLSYRFMPKELRDKVTGKEKDFSKGEEKNAKK